MKVSLDDIGLKNKLTINLCSALAGLSAGFIYFVFSGLPAIRQTIKSLNSYNNSHFFSSASSSDLGAIGNPDENTALFDDIEPLFASPYTSIN